MGFLHGIGGIFFSIAWFVFFDGFTFAKRENVPYEFLMWLPGILCLSAMLVMLFVSPQDLKPRSDDFMMGGGGDETTLIRAKIFFFIAAVLALCGLSLAVWKMSDTYANNKWPGVALLLQCVCLGLSNGVLFWARSERTQSEF